MIREYLKNHPELSYVYVPNHKDPRRRQSLKVYFSMNKDHPAEKDLPELCRKQGLPYSLIPTKGGNYYIYITPHIYE